MAKSVPGAYRKLGVGIALTVFVADQFVKWIVTYPLQLELRQTIDLLPFFQLTWVRNHGVSMGLLTAESDLQRWLLTAFTAAIAVGVAAWMWRERNREDIIALALVLGGAMGNILDRIRLGYVVDYADLHFGSIRPFLVFNVGDAAITIGVLLLVVRAFLTRDAKPGKEE